MKNPIYLCPECKKVYHNVEDCHFVDPQSSKSFCSEDCILNFYAPLMNYFEKEEENFCQKFSVKKLKIKKSEQRKYGEETLQDPQEIWVLKNEIGETYTTFLQDFVVGRKKIHVIIIALTFDNNPSLILHQCVSSSEKIKEQYRRGENLQDLSQGNVQKVNVNLDENVINNIESKRDNYYHNLVRVRSESDFPIDNFPIYENFLSDTLSEPDEIYRHVDEDDDTILTYFKGHQHDGIPFYYVVVCYHHSTDIKNDSETIIPILSFPSKDKTFTCKFKKGEKISGQMKN